MTFSTGTRLGPYEVISLIGSGGMGEVYRARDTKLNRDIAVKVLPELFAADPDRLTRFKREAQLLAALSHPNIAGIHGLEDTDGTPALVLELVEGPTLADRIGQGAMPLDEALPIARQIAEALEAAHERGIVHRDLKPANIKVRNDGAVKVLDFGLAKALEEDARAGAVSQSPTLSVAATRAGVILGTAAYMAPEQARGKAVDKRADIWAFGCVLYEMLAGVRAFGGEEIADTLAAIITKEPDWHALPTATPPAIHRLLRRCLAKDRKNRLPDIGAARLEIDDALTPQQDAAISGGIAVAGVRSRRNLVASAAIAVAVLASAVAGAALFMRPGAPNLVAYRSSIQMPPDNVLGYSGGRRPFDAELISLSPDGRYLVFVATAGDGTQRLWLQRLDTSTAQPMAGTEGGSSPFWSPDSRVVAFFAEGKLKTLDIAGGTPVAVCDAVDAVGGTWNNADVILFGSAQGPIQRVQASGGTPIAATTLGKDETAHWSPSFLPDGRDFLYTAAIVPTPTAYVRGVLVGNLDSGNSRLVLEEQTNAQYANGHLLFVRNTLGRSVSSLMTQPFDTNALELRGTAVPLVEQVRTAGIPSVRGVFSVSTTGVLVAELASGPASSSQLHWYDRAGRDLGQVGEPADYVDVVVSPEGTQAAASILDPSRGTSDIWLFDIGRGLRTRFTSDSADDMGPLWSPDGQRIVFISTRNGVMDVFMKTVQGATGERALLEDRSDKYPGSWSTDGRFLLLTRNTTGVGTAGDLYRLPFAEDRKELVPFLVTAFSEWNPAVSPDGRWVAFESDESGRSEIYIASFPKGEAKWLVSRQGGQFARWRRDGRELYYLEPSGMLIAAAVDGRGARPEVSSTQPLFRVPRRQGRIARYGGYRYDLSPDGQRFLVEVPLSTATPRSTTLVVNWPALNN